MTLEEKILVDKLLFYINGVLYSRHADLYKKEIKEVIKSVEHILKK